MSRWLRQRVSRRGTSIATIVPVTETPPPMLIPGTSRPDTSTLTDDSTPLLKVRRDDGAVVLLVTRDGVFEWGEAVDPGEAGRLFAEAVSDYFADHMLLQFTLDDISAT